MSKEVIDKTNTAIKFRLFFKGGQQAIALVLGIVLARILSPSEFGVIAIANMVIHYANNFTNFGLNNAFVQSDRVRDDHINTVFTIDIIISIVIFILTILVADYIAIFFHNQSVSSVLKWMSLYYIITSFYHIPVVILRREIKFRFLTVIEFMEALLTSIGAILLGLYGYSYWSIVFSSLIISMIVTIVLMWKTHWIPKLTIGKNMGELYSFGFWNFIRAQLELLVSKVDYFVIGRYLDAPSLGIYEKSFELTARAAAGLSMPLHGIFFSTFSRVKSDVCQVKQIFLESSAILALVCYPVLFGLIGVAPHFVMSCLGSKWEHAIMPLQILATGSIIRVLLGNVANVNVAIGKYKEHTLINGLSASIFVFLCFSLVRYGIVAISVAYLAYCLVSFLASFWIVHVNAHVKFLELIGAVLYPLLGSIIMLSIVISIRFILFTDFTSILQFICLAVTGVIIYLGWCYFFYRRGLINISIKGTGKY